MSFGEGDLRLLLSAVLLGLALAPASHAENEARDRIITAKAHTLNIKSAAALVLAQDEDRVLYTKNEDAVMPIASITKLMTGLVVLEMELPLDEAITISREDVDGIKRTRSRLRVGLTLTREDLLRLALMSSENRAAAALARAYPGGTTAFVAAMNQKAVELGMWNTRFADGTGLSRENVATAQDLVRLVSAAYEHPRIREYSTDISHTVALANGQRLRFWNSNRLVNNPHWDIGLSKTGYIVEAGRCLVLQARIADTPVIIVLLESWGKNTRIGDANRIKRWMESNITRQPAS
jgi:serine-type D-Ala-D-Ala endopeptidase (penicillin-binding protein 7)